MSMSSVYQITLQQLAAERQKLTEIIVSVAMVAGIDPEPYLAATTVAETRVPKVKTKQAKRKTTRAKKGTKRAARPTKKAQSELGTEILAALKNGPMSPGAVAKRLGANVMAVRYHVKKLIAAGSVKATGSTNDRQLAVA